jgi:hypothetical protein
MMIVMSSNRPSARLMVLAALALGVVALPVTKPLVDNYMAVVDGFDDQDDRIGFQAPPFTSAADRLWEDAYGTDGYGRSCAPAEGWACGTVGVTQSAANLDVLYESTPDSDIYFVVRMLADAAADDRDLAGAFAEVRLITADGAVLATADI